MDAAAQQLMTKYTIMYNIDYSSKKYVMNSSFTDPAKVGINDLINQFVNVFIFMVL